MAEPLEEEAETTAAQKQLSKDEIIQPECTTHGKVLAIHCSRSEQWIAV
jgi:hypothetical protein